MPPFVHSSWGILARTAILVLGSYVCLVAMLRLSGKRTLAQMDPFDFVITTALGSTMANVAIDDKATLTQGIVAFGSFIFLQWLVNGFTSRSQLARHLVKPTPRLLFHRGRFIDHAMRHDRVAESEVVMAVRKNGYASLDEIEAVVLEPDSSFSVLPKQHAKRDIATLADVAGAPPEAARDMRNLIPSFESE